MFSPPICYQPSIVELDESDTTAKIETAVEEAKPTELPDATSQYKPNEQYESYVGQPKASLDRELVDIRLSIERSYSTLSQEKLAEELIHYNVQDLDNTKTQLVQKHLEQELLLRTKKEGNLSKLDSLHKSLPKTFNIVSNLSDNRLSELYISLACPSISEPRLFLQNRDPISQNLSKAVALFIHKDQIHRQGRDSISIRLRPYNQVRVGPNPICPDPADTFNSSFCVSSPHCTAFFDSKNSALTSCHCLKSGDKPINLTNYRIVTNFSFDSVGRVISKLSVDNVMKITKKGNCSNGIVRIQISGKPQLDTIISNQTEDVDLTDMFYAIGHPIGLPKVYIAATGNAKIYSDTPDQLQVGLYGDEGISGSPVFSYKTNSLIGIYNNKNSPYRDVSAGHIRCRCRFHDNANGEATIKLIKNFIQ